MGVSFTLKLGHVVEVLRSGKYHDPPRRHKSTPSSPRFGTGVSAALSSRDTGERRASLGDSGDATPACA